jgi:ATP-dependent DNA helicase RecG
VVPIYGLTQGLYQNTLRKIAREVISRALPHIVDPLEAEREKWNLMPLAEALRQIHFPESRELFRNARRRLAFDEFFYLQLALLLKRREQNVQPRAHRMLTEGPLLQRFFDLLPFTLTGAQQRVIADIKSDLASGHVMNRLVQGDVGSGKTEVAVAALAMAAQSNCQTALMAPTEILAEQHYFKLSRYLGPLGIPCYFLAGKLPAKEKQALQQALDTGAPCVVVGTHALIQDGVRFQRLGLVIVDEQHRFGVRQRNELQRKGYHPDMLMLTATPIPRSLSLTLYGDLDKSIMDEYPPGRQPVPTHWLRSARKKEAYDWTRVRLAAGERAYVVFPLVETSPKLALQAATESAALIQTQVFPDFKVGLLHGRMKPAEKTTVMDSFRRGDIQVLVATTVIEVGVDVPEATVIIIEHAERFGLSQLHQLRGRVGRGRGKSYCLLIGDPKGDESRRRLKALVESNDGFHIAEVDLQIRGPGDFFGLRQSGIPGFKVADLIRDERILIEAKKRASECLQGGMSLSVQDELRRRMSEFLGDTRLN